MGCDIHGYAEVRTADGWQKVGAIFRDPSYPTYCKREFNDEFFDDRDYRLFAVLANVRNGYETKYPVISEPRGLPEDASLEIRDKHNIWDGDAHSTSWLTLKEVLGYDWTQKVQVGDAWEPLIECLPEVFFENMALLARLAPPEDARLVFWFDN